MRQVRPLFLSTFPPQKCGLATFTRDSADAVDAAAGASISSIAAVQQTEGLQYDDPRVVHVIDKHCVDAYSLAADMVNEAAFDVVSLQHEFGLFSGKWGGHVLDFVRACEIPIVTTFHTMMTEPEPEVRRLIQTLAAASHSVVVMTERAKRLMSEVYLVSGPRVQVIPHGVPEIPIRCGRRAKDRLGLSDQKVVCTFGLISRGKGLEQMIKAMPRIVEVHPDTVYVVIGATHPQVKKHEGETYRQSLETMANALGVGDHVRFVNRFLSPSALKEHLQACDIFVTPYPGKDQIASGTLAYALSASLAVVSTPYLYAEEVLAEGRGQLVPFNDVDAIANATLRYLDSPAYRVETGRRAYRYAIPMAWPNVGRSYLNLFEGVAFASQSAKPIHQSIATAIPASGSWD